MEYTANTAVANFPRDVLQRRSQPYRLYDGSLTEPNDMYNKNNYNNYPHSMSKQKLKTKFTSLQQRMIESSNLQRLTADNQEPVGLPGARFCFSTPDKDSSLSADTSRLLEGTLAKSIDPNPFRSPAVCKKTKNKKNARPHDDKNEKKQTKNLYDIYMYFIFLCPRKHTHEGNLRMMCMGKRKLTYTNSSLLFIACVAARVTCLLALAGDTLAKQSSTQSSPTLQKQHTVDELTARAVFVCQDTYPRVCASSQNLVFVNYGTGKPYH